MRRCGWVRYIQMMVACTYFGGCACLTGGGRVESWVGQVDVLVGLFTVQWCRYAFRVLGALRSLGLAMVEKKVTQPCKRYHIATLSTSLVFGLYARRAN